MRFGQPVVQTSAVSAVLVALVIPAVLVIFQATVSLANDREALDSARHDYRDHDDGRTNAAVRAAVRPEGDTTLLELTVSALGPLVEPPRGFEGISGANRITAEELEMLLDGRRTLSGETLHAATGMLDAGTFREGSRGRLPVRRLLCDGRIVYHGLTRDELPLELILQSRLDGDGDHWVTWRVDGIPRLRVTVEVHRGEARIVRIDGLDPAPPREPATDIAAVAGGRTLVTALRDAVDTGPVEAPVDLDEWRRRDAEGRWALFWRSVEADPASARRWVRFLAERRELELLEWVAIYRPRSFHVLDVGTVLAEIGAPQWIRVAVWNLGAVDGHTMQSAEAQLLLSRPAEVLNWLRRHPAVVKGTVAEVFAELERRTGPAAALDGALAPLDPAVVFAHLDAPARIADLGDRERAERDTVYLHQVFREIDGLVALRTPEPTLLEKLDTLTRHASERVRQKALLAYTYVSPNLVEHDHFLVTARSTTELPRVREAALLAASYSRHPRVWLALHHIAFDERHPAWRAAVSRLGDIGDEFTLDVLGGRKLDSEAGEFLLHELARIRKRIEAWRRQGPDVLAARLAAIFERAAWADLQCDSLQTRIVPWAQDLARPHLGNEAVRRKLLEVRDHYSPAFDGRTRFGRLRDRVREYVERLLATATDRDTRD